MAHPNSRPKKIDQLQDWCVRNPWLSIFFGIVIIFIGLLISDANKQGVTGNFFERVDWSSVISHLFVILGEAIIVMFFLHMFIEKSTSNAHTEHSAEILKNLGRLSSEILENKKDEIENVFGGMIKKFTDEADKTTAALKVNLFAAILQDKMPHEIVKLVLDSNFFNTNILRRNLVITYLFKEVQDETIVVEQRLSFDMEYISGKEDKLKYFMPFALSDTPLAKYEFVMAGYRRVYAKKSNELIKFNEAEHYEKKSYGLNKEKDTFKLKEPIELGKNECINVQQVFNAKYNIDAKGTVDNYYVNNHSVDVTVIFDFPSGFEINVYPTFPEINLPKRSEVFNKISYENIPFLVPGQGYIFSIKKL